MINVLHIRSSFNAGGTETLLLNLFNHQQDMFCMHLVLIKGGNMTAKLANKENNLHEFYRNHFVDYSVLKNIQSLIKREKINIIHTHQEIELLYAVIIKIFNPGIKIYHTIHLINSKLNFAHYLERILVTFCHKIITVSKSVEDFQISKGYPVGKIVTLYNAVEVKNNLSIDEKDFIAKQLSLKPSDFVLMMVGNFRPEKDHLTVIKSYNLLRKKYPFLKLAFIGKENELTKHCLALTLPEDVNTRVWFLGEIQDAWKYLQFAGLFVFSSKSETFGIAVIEALLMRIPVLASDIPVMKELSDNETFFHLFKTGDEVTLAEKIEWYICHRTDVSVIEKIDASYNYALKTFSYHNFIRGLTTLYNL